MNTRVKKRTKKYGILVSNTIEEKYDLDKKNVALCSEFLLPRPKIMVVFVEL